jgi:hypothetical protein
MIALSATGRNPVLRILQGGRDRLGQADRAIDIQAIGLAGYRRADIDDRAIEHRAAEKMAPLLTIQPNAPS